MLAGIERLRRAREILSQEGQNSSDGALECLAEAAGECWSAAIDWDSWPVSLRVQAAVVQRSMFLHGAIRTTVEQMSDADREKLRRDILELVDAAERSPG